MVYCGYISDVLIDHLYHVLDQFKSTNENEDPEYTCTINGFQTTNTVKKIDNDLFFREMSPIISDYLRIYYENQLLQYSCCIDHVHIIEYRSGGKQLKHNHAATEDHSFIIYMNDSNGATRIYSDADPVDVSCTRGKIVIFNAAFEHEGLDCLDKKVVAVGAIRFSNKTWKPRNLKAITA